jgi:hypothetical protein
MGGRRRGSGAEPRRSNELMGGGSDTPHLMQKSPAIWGRSQTAQRQSAGGWVDTSESGVLTTNGEMKAVELRVVQDCGTSIGGVIVE